MRSLRVAIGWALLAPISFAVVQHTTISIKSPIKRISGRIVDYGAINPGVNVQIFDNPQVWADSSLSLNEKRNRQTRIASVTTGPDGRFEFRHIPKGSYEIQFSKDGWDLLSALVEVDPTAAPDRLCVKLRISDANFEPSIQPCRR
jgi:hypothetical protein